MGSILRLIIGIPIAAIITLLLFRIMYELIKTDGPQLEEAKDPVNISIGRQIDDSADAAQKTDLARPKLDQPPPPPPAINQADFKPKVDGVQAARPEFDTKVEISSGFNPDRDAQPLVRIPPRYPDNCSARHRNIENITIEFDVTPDGQVANVKIVNSSNSCFNRASIRAAQRWKYQPKIENEEAKWRYGVRTNFRYDPPPE